MCKQKMLRTFSLHIVPKGVPPLETPTAPPSGSRLLGTPFGKREFLARAASKVKCNTCLV
jgi:hypothetical protein